MNSSIKILVIIVTWNKKEYVIDLLNSLARIDFPRDKLNVVVVDNASNDGTVEAISQQFSEVSIIQNPENLGGTGGFNTGLAWAFDRPEGEYDYIWLLDNDVVVHRNALGELVNVLEQNPDVAVAGSTMMQLDYPWRINEMGAFVDRNNGSLVLNRHFEEVPGWRGNYKFDDLLQREIDLSESLTHCQPLMDVDYVAAASLLIRAPVAKEAGLWMDFFIHFDDVEWCLRIAEMGHRIVVSSRSLIWHLSAIAKVPSWVLYYDNRNVLFLLEKHSGMAAVRSTSHYILKKSLYYCLLGKKDLADLHIEAVMDYLNKISGKKDIKLNNESISLSQFSSVLENKDIKKVLIPWTIDLQGAGIQTAIVKAMKQRSDLSVYYLQPPANSGFSERRMQLPGAIPISVSSFSLWGLIQYYFLLKGQFDIVLQSDYQIIIPLSWLGRENIFMNYESFCRRRKPELRGVIKHLLTLMKIRLRLGKLKVG